MGAGKSTVLAIFERVGAAVLSSDAVVHELYEQGAVRDAVLERFGSEVAPDGVVDRTAIARIAFADPLARSWLEGLLWPAVRAEIAEWRERQESVEPPPLALVVEVPLLFESDLDRLFDATVTVTATEDLRTDRAHRRGHEAVQERSALQLSQEEKAARATYVITNDGGEKELEPQVEKILAELGA